MTGARRCPLSKVDAAQRLIDDLESIPSTRRNYNLSPAPGTACDRRPGGRRHDAGTERT